MIWNNTQQIRHNLQRAEPAYNEQNKTRNSEQQADFEIILQYGAIGSLL